MKTIKAVLAAAAAAAAICAAGQAIAAYPDGSDVTVIIPRNPGGGTDTTARGVVRMMEKDMGNIHFVCVNKLDDSGLAGMQDIADAKPDGLTLGMVTVVLAIFTHQRKTKLSYKDFDSIIAPIAAPAALIVPSKAPYNTLDEFIAYLEKNPGKVRMGNSGEGAIWDLATMAMEQEFGVKVKHIPYPKGTADIAAAIAGGRIDGALADPSSFKTQVEAGKLKILAVMSDKRSKMFPDVPTFKEQGHDMVVRAWATLVAPKGTPADVMKKLRDSAARVAATEEFSSYFLKQGIDPTDIVGEDANKMMKADDELFADLLSPFKK
jgi:tripartite-type tricarboxylate transporter receptor subunit TctC